MTSLITLATNPTTKKQIRDALVEISAALTRAEAERDLITNIVNDICDQHQIEPKVFRKTARAYHKQNFAEEVAENRDFEAFYENLIGTPTTIDQIPVNAANSVVEFKRPAETEGGSID